MTAFARVFVLVLASAARPAHAAADAAPGWLPWLVIGAIALFVVGVVVRMVLSSRFPKGYRQWAASRREDFVTRNEQWDRADEDFKR